MLSLSPPPTFYDVYVNAHPHTHACAYAVLQFNLAECYRLGEGVEKDLEEMLDLYEASAAQGFSHAKVALERFNKAADDVFDKTTTVGEDMARAAEVRAAEGLPPLS